MPSKNKKSALDIELKQSALDIELGQSALDVELKARSVPSYQKSTIPTVPSPAAVPAIPEGGAVGVEPTTTPAPAVPPPVKPGLWDRMKTGMAISATESPQAAIQPKDMEKYIKGVGQALEMTDMPRRFLMGVTAYGLETAPARSVRGATRALNPLVWARPKKFMEVLEEPTLPFKFSNFIEAGKKAATGDTYVTADYLVNRGVMTTGEMRKIETFLDRHPKIKFANNLAVLADDLAVAIIAEAAAFQGAKAGAVKINSFFRGTSPGKLKAGFQAAMIAQIDAQDLSADTLRMMDIAPGELGGQTLGNMDELVKGLSPFTAAAKEADEAVKIGLTKGFIKETASGPNPIVPSSTLNSYIKGHSFGKALGIDDLDNMTLPQLTELTNSLGMYMQSPEKIGFLLKAGSHVHTPSWRFFREIGLWRPYSKIDDGAYMSDMIIDSWERFVVGQKKSFKKIFGINWDDTVNEIAFRYQDKGPAAEIPSKLINQLGRSGIKKGKSVDDALDFINDVVRVNKANYMDELADLGVRAGYLDPEDINKWYAHHASPEVLKERTTQLAREGFSPTDPKKMFAPQILERKYKIKELATDWESINRLTVRNEARKFLMQRPMDILDEAVKSYPEWVQTYHADWQKYGIFRHPTRTDALFNQGLNVISRKIDKLTHGRWEATGRAWENATLLYRKSAATGLLLGNWRPVFKNLFQSILTDNIIGPEATYRGMQSMFTKGGRELLDSFFFMHNRLPLGNITGVNVASPKGWNNLAYGGIAAVDKYMNCASAANGTLWKLIAKSPKHLDELAEYGAKVMKLSRQQATDTHFFEVLAHAIKNGKFAPQVDIAKQVLYFSQWDYHIRGMGRYSWSSAGKTLGQFQNWPSHFWGAHMPQLFKQLMGGPTVFGEAATGLERLALLQFMAKGAFMSQIGKQIGYNMDHLTVMDVGKLPPETVVDLMPSFSAKGPLPVGQFIGVKLPFPMAPGTELSTSIGLTILGTAIRHSATTNAGLRGLKRALTVPIPGVLPTKHLLTADKEESILPLIASPTRTEKNKKGTFNFTKLR